MKKSLLLQLKSKRENSIAIGFMFEVILFMLAGYFFAKTSLFGFIILAAAIWVAFAVGEKIARNEVINYKWCLK